MHESTNSNADITFKSRRSLTLPFAALLVLALSGCQQQQDIALPLLEAESIRPLQREAAKALSGVRTAKENTGPGRADVLEPLTEAETALTHLASYYMPLVEARTRTYNAYRHLASGQQASALYELQTTEELLMRVAAGEVEQGELAVRDPVEKLAAARMAITANSADALKLVDELAALLNHAILKGALELGGG